MKSFLNASPLSFGIRPRGIDSATGASFLPHAARFKTGGAPMTAQQLAMAAASADDQATMLIKQRSQPIIQQMFSNAMGAGNNGALGQTFVYNLQNVGLNRRVILEFTGTITPTAETLTATPWSVLNLISKIVLTDLANYDRINTNARHLHAVATANKRGNYLGAFVNDGIARIGNNMNVQNAQLAANAAFNFRFFVELPLSVTPDNFKGAVWANVTGGTWRVAITVANAAAAFPGSAATDLSNAAYQSDQVANGAILTAMNCAIFQDYLYNIPTNPKTGDYILPTLSLAHNYLLISAPFANVVANTDFAIQYTNNRTFLSTMFEYINNGVQNPGTDLAYVGVQIANQLFIRKTDPFMLGAATREMIGGDYPAGFYMVSHREKPILTNNSGNTQLVINATTAVNAVGTAYWEMISVQNAAVNGTSLPAS